MGFDLLDWVTAAGYPGMAAVIFAETGLLLGFFLPGDTLLLSAGLLAQRGHFHLAILLPLLVLAAIIGDSTGYFIGDRAGHRLFQREDGRFFPKHHLERARLFYARHGGKTIFIARFVGFIRTFAPTVAGAAQMSYRRFLVFNVSGALVWVVSLVVLGYFAGTKVENTDLYFAVLFGAAACLSVFGFAGRWVHQRLGRRPATSSS